MDDNKVIDLFSGTDASGSPFWLYIAIQPDKYRTWRTRVDAAEEVVFSDHGEILVGGKGWLPPTEVQALMTEHFGFVHGLERAIIGDRS